MPKGKVIPSNGNYNNCRDCHNFNFHRTFGMIECIRLFFKVIFEIKIVVSKMYKLSIE